MGSTDRTVFGNKYLYLGTYGTQEEAAHAYDIAAIEYRGINAVTNFDLSTYIRWLRSSSSHTATAQDRMMPSNSHTSQTNSPRIVDEPQFSSFNSNNLFPMGIPHNQQLFEPKVSATTSNESSPAPTALGLLLKSSMFKQLVEKNLDASDEQESGENDNAKNALKTEGNEFRGIFFNGMCPTMESSSGMELDEELEEEKNELPLFSNIATSTRNQPLWNGSLNMNMSSSRH